MPRSRRPLKFKFPAPVLKTWIFRAPQNNGKCCPFFMFCIFNMFTNANRNKTVPVLNNTFLNPVKQG